MSELVTRLRRWAHLPEFKNCGEAARLNRNGMPRTVTTNRFGRNGSVNPGEPEGDRDDWLVAAANS
jgi:hypothetical protein